MRTVPSTSTFGVREDRGLALRSVEGDAVERRTAARVLLEAVGNVQVGIDGDGIETFVPVGIVGGERLPVARRLRAVVIIEAPALIAGRARNVGRFHDPDRSPPVAYVTAGLGVRRLDHLAGERGGVDPVDAIAFAAVDHPGSHLGFRDILPPHQDGAFRIRQPVDDRAAAERDILVVGPHVAAQQLDVLAVGVDRDQASHADQLAADGGARADHVDGADEPDLRDPAATVQPLRLAVGAQRPARGPAAGGLDGIEEGRLARTGADERDLPARRRETNREHAFTRAEGGRGIGGRPRRVRRSGCDREESRREAGQR
jgi:hypothetical protein